MTGLTKLGSLLAGTAIMLSACVSVLPEPETPDALYRLDAARGVRSLPVNLVVREPNAPNILAGQAMASVDGSGAIRLVPSVEWAGRSTRLMQLALVDSFTSTGDGAALLPEASLSAPIELSSRIKAFELRGDTAVCEITVMLSTTVSRELVAQNHIAVGLNAVSDSNRDRALALKRAGDTCIENIADFAVQAINDVPSVASEN